MIQYETSPWLRDMANSAVRAKATTQFPPAVLLTAAANESAWGTKVTGDFNFYGIVAHPEDRPCKMCPTHEDIFPYELADFRPDERATAAQGAALGFGKFRYSMQRWFASYASMDEGVLAYIEFFTKSPHRYQGAWQQYLTDHDETALLKHICEAGYATGNAETVEMAILQQSNIAHAVQMAEAAVNG